MLPSHVCSPCGMSDDNATGGAVETYGTRRKKGKKVRKERQGGTSVERASPATGYEKFHEADDDPDPSPKDKYTQCIHHFHYIISILLHSLFMREHSGP